VHPQVLKITQNFITRSGITATWKNIPFEDFMKNVGQTFFRISSGIKGKYFRRRIINWKILPYKYQAKDKR